MPGMVARPRVGRSGRRHVSDGTETIATPRLSLPGRTLRGSAFDSPCWSASGSESNHRAVAQVVLLASINYLSYNELLKRLNRSMVNPWGQHGIYQSIK
jgi:hypothetical protein